MKPLSAALLAVVLSTPVAFAPAAADANVIQQACLMSERGQGNRTLCRCIQTAANATLTRRDQRKGSKFFSEPGAAQEVRQSDRRSDEVFWERWTAFGEHAEAICS